MKARLTLTILLLAAFLVPARLNANLGAINFGEIRDWKSIEAELIWLWDNQKIYRRYYSEWKFDKPREEYIAKLEALLKKLDAMEDKNRNVIDYFLLKGDIAHFLYNLDVIDYHDMAIGNYDKAQALDKTDYRPAWFKGNHLVLSMNVQEGMECYFDVLNSTPPEKLHPLCWGDYSDCSMIGGMIANAVMAYEFFAINSNDRSYLDDDYYKEIKGLLETPDPAGKFGINDIWVKATYGEIYLSRPLGMRIFLDEGWDYKCTGYQNRGGLFSAFPPQLTGTTGAVGYTISVFAFVSVPGDKIEDYVARIKSGFADIKKISIDNRFNSTEVYEGYEKTVYENEGGGHFVIMFIERDEPQYPSVAVEYPLYDKKGYGQAIIEKSMGRFSGKMYYMIMLDCSESIYPQALEVYKKFISSNLVLD